MEKEKKMKIPYTEKELQVEVPYIEKMIKIQVPPIQQPIQPVMPPIQQEVQPEAQPIQQPIQPEIPPIQQPIQPKVEVKIPYIEKHKKMHYDQYIYYQMIPVCYPKMYDYCMMMAQYHQQMYMHYCKGLPKPQMPMMKYYPMYKMSYDMDTDECE